MTEEELYEFVKNHDHDTLFSTFYASDIPVLKLKSEHGWKGVDNGDNSSVFSALPGGFRDYEGNFHDLGSFGSWWSAAGPNIYTYMNSNFSITSLDFLSYLYKYGRSIRCVKD